MIKDVVLCKGMQVYDKDYIGEHNIYELVRKNCVCLYMQVFLPCWSGKNNINNMVFSLSSIACTAPSLRSFLNYVTVNCLEAIKLQANITCESAHILSNDKMKNVLNVQKYYHFYSGTSSVLSNIGKHVQIEWVGDKVIKIVIVLFLYQQMHVFAFKTPFIE